MRRDAIQAAAAGLVGLGLLGVLLWRTPPSELAAHLGGAHPQLLVVVLVIHLLALVLRIGRWRALLADAGLPTDDGRLIADAAFFGWLVNLTIPARAGELARPALYAARARQPFAQVLATVVVERVADLLVLAIGAAAVLAALPPPAALPPGLGLALRGAAGLAAIAGVILGLLARRPSATGGLLARFRAGLVTLGSAGRASRLLAWTTGIWALEASQAWVALRAFDLPALWGAAVAQVASVTVALGILTVPGGVGVEQGVTVAVFTAYGLPENTSLAVSLALTVAAAAWVVPGGLRGMVRQGARLADLRAVAGAGDAE